MGFDISTATPVESQGFDLSTARPANSITGTPLRVSNSGEYDPTSAAYQAKYGTTSGNSFLRNAVIGVGKLYTDAGLGAQQLYASAADTVAPQQQTVSGLISGALPSRVAVLQQQAADKRATDVAITHTAGGKVGMIAGSLPLAFLPGVNTYAGAAALGGSLGALTPTTANDSRLQNTGLGAGLGIAGKYVGDKLSSGLSQWLNSRRAAAAVPALTDAQQQAANEGVQLGMQMTPGQQSGSRALQMIEAKAESQPWTAGPINAIKTGNQRVMNRAAAQSIGESGDALDSTVLANASDRLGSVFESVRNPNNIVATAPAVTTRVLDGIEQDVQGLLPGGASIRDNPLVSNLETLANSGSVNGQQLGQLSSKLGKAAYKQMSSPAGDRDWGQALYAVKDHVDDLLESSLSGPEAAAYSTARQQYRNLMLLTSRTNIVNPSTGNVTGTALATKLQQADRNGFLFGQNQTPLYSAARFSQAFKPIVGDSGTATRSMTAGDLALLPFGIPANLAMRAYLTGIGGGVARGAVAVPGMLANTAAEAGSLLVPPLRTGLPALGGSLVPYLTQ